MSAPGSATADEVERSLRTILAECPEASVVALDDTGGFTDLPPTIPLAGRSVLQGTHPLNLVAGSDMQVMIETWDRVQLHGEARVKVRLADGTSGVFHCFDVRPLHGCFVLVLESSGPGGPRATPRAQRSRPQVCRMRKNAVAVLTEVDAATGDMFGWSEEELLGRRSADLLHPADYDLAVESWLRLMGTPGGTQTYRVRHLCKDGRVLWTDVINHNRIDDPAHGDVATEIIDVSDEVAAQQALAEREELLNLLTESLPSGVLQLSAGGRVVYRNQRLEAVLGAPGSETLDELLVHLVADDRRALHRGIAEVLEGDEGDGHELDVRLTVPGSGPERTANVVVRGLHGTTRGAIVMITDITDTARRRAELEVQATVDALTGCHNRVAILDALAAALADPERADGGTAVLFIDLDRFKPINDEHGHAVGDHLLRLVAERLRATVRTGDLVGRFGGDEFLVVCPDVARPEVAREVADRLAAALDQQVTVAGATFRSSASIGLAWTRNGAADVDALIARADEAMYEVKRAQQRP